MKTKILDLFSGKNSAINPEKKYSDLLDEFISPFVLEFPEDTPPEEMLYFGIHAWNLGALSLLIEDEEFEKILSGNDFPEPEGGILLKMIALKREKFAEYDRFMVDFMLEENGGEQILTVMTTDSESFRQEMVEKSFHDDSDETEFDQGYIDRFAIVLKPQEPFFNWLKTFNINYSAKLADHANIYLVNDNISDLDQWLRKKFDKFFMLELEEWHSNKKVWPQKRTYKMFKEWFIVDKSIAVYDLEYKPVRKE